MLGNTLMFELYTILQKTGIITLGNVKGTTKILQVVMRHGTSTTSMLHTDNHTRTRQTPSSSVGLQTDKTRTYTYMFPSHPRCRRPYHCVKSHVKGEDASRDVLGARCGIARGLFLVHTAARKGGIGIKNIILRAIFKVVQVVVKRWGMWSLEHLLVGMLYLGLGKGRGARYVHCSLQLGTSIRVVLLR